MGIFGSKSKKENPPPTVEEYHDALLRIKNALNHTDVSAEARLKRIEVIIGFFETTNDMTLD